MATAAEDKGKERRSADLRLPTELLELVVDNFTLATSLQLDSGARQVQVTCITSA